MAEDKYIIFLFATILCVPLGILLSCLSRKFHDLVFMGIVFGTCMPHSLFGFPTDINFLSAEWYRGSTRGVEISYLDLLAIILLVSSIYMRVQEKRRFYWPPSLGYLLAYFVFCCITVVAFSDQKLFGLFEITKCLRAIILFVAVAFYVRSLRELEIFIWVLAATIFYQAGICIRDRYLFGVHRVRGTLGHPNTLSMYCLQCVPIFVTLYFSKSASWLMRAACIFGYLAASGCILLSISRTGFAALILLSGGAFVISAGLRLTPRNVALAFLGVVLLSLMLVKSWDSTMSRLSGFDLEREYLDEEGDRGQYFRYAAPALADHPLIGVGFNNWSWAISNKYAQESGNSSIRPYTGYLSEREVLGTAPAHNLYLLTLTELGAIGLVLLLALFGRWIWMNGSVLLGRQTALEDAVRIGACLSLAGVLLQSWTEWEFRQTPIFFLSHVIMGVGATLYHFRPRPGRRR